MKKKTIILGVILGILSPIVGIFAGLQISTTLGNILAFPIIALSYVTGTPFGMWPGIMFIPAFAISIAVWILIVHLISKLLGR